MSLYVFVLLLLAFGAAGPAAGAATPSPAAGYDLVASATPTLQGKPGSTVAAVVSWRNAGPAQAPALRIIYIPPLGTDVPASGLPAGWRTSGRGAVRVTTGVLRAGAAGSASIPVRIPAKTVPGTLLVGGVATVQGLTGKDRNPANNTAYNRVQVAKAAPSPSITRTPTPKASPSTARPTPSRQTTTGTPRPQPRPRTTARAVEPSLTASTYVVAAPQPTGSAQPSIVPEVIQVTDGGLDESPVPWVPLVGAIACFAAAGFGAVAFRRNRAAVHAHEAEIRSLHEIY